MTGTQRHARPDPASHRAAMGGAKRRAPPDPTL